MGTKCILKYIFVRKFDSKKKIGLAVSEFSVSAMHDRAVVGPVFLLHSDVVSIGVFDSAVVLIQ